MESATEATPFAPEQEVSVVFHTDANPHLVRGLVMTTSPLVVRSSDPGAGRIARQRRAVLIGWRGEEMIRVDSEVLRLTPEGDFWWIELDVFRSETVDRRRYPRFPVQMPVTIRTVVEENGLATPTDLAGTTTDLSLGGAYIQVTERIEPMSLVEVKLSLSETESIRALGVVAHGSISKNMVGVEFVDFIGGARYHLFSFLNRAA